MEIYCGGLDGHHEYAEESCPVCGQDFCYACSGFQNVDVGNRYGQPKMLGCPVCGWNIYSEEDPSEYRKKVRRQLEDRLRKDPAALRDALAATKENNAVVSRGRYEYLESIEDSE